MGAFGRNSVDPERFETMVESMVELLAHRGTATIRRTSHVVVAGLQRDPESGAEAVLHAEDDLVALFDGELLNRAELAGALDAAQWTAAKLVAHLYRQHGPTFIERLEGPFALAVIDGDRILLARDAVGVRPLYIRKIGDTLLFASEAKALLEEPTTIDMETLLERFVFSDHALGRSTLFRDVQSVAPGDGWRLPVDGWRETATPPATPATSDESKVPPPTANRQPPTERAIRAIVEENVRHYLQRYRTVGILLSGGFDSSVLACLAQHDAPGRVRTFTIGDSEDYPDVRAARQVAQHLGTEHHELLVDAPDPADLVRGIHAYEDLSYRDTLFILARRMAGMADVALSGTGADLLGNPVLFSTEVRLPKTLDNWRRLSASLRDPERRRIAVYMERFLRELEQDREAAVLRHFLDDYIPNQLIPSTERALSYWGMEAAFPFADRRLLRMAQQVPTAAERTQLIRAAFADLDLPANILERPKLCSKQGLVKVKTLAREAGGAAGGNRLGGLLRTDFEARCYELLETIFLEHRGRLGSIED